MQTYYTFNRATRRPTGEIQSLHKPQYASDIPPPKALEGHYVAYDIIGKSWAQIPITVPVEPTLDELKTSMITEINSRTGELIRSGFSYDSTNFSMSRSAQLNWASLATALNFSISSGCSQADVDSILVMGGGSYQISTVDEGIYTFTSKAGFDGFFNAYLSYQTDPSQPLTSGRLLKAQVEAATTEAELDLVIDSR